MKKLTLLVVASLLLSGCGSLLKSDYQRPMLSVPTQWQVQDTGPRYLNHSTHWWDNFNDPLLSQLISRALTSNNDLALAGIQLQQARLQAGLTNTNLTPNVTVSGSASNSQGLKHNAEAQESYGSSVDLSYELDLWGKLARTRDQAEWLVKASEQDRQNIALTLIGTTAQLYWQVANLNQQINNQQASLTIASDTLRIVQSRYAAGDVGQLDLLQAQQSLLDRENQYRNLQQQREEARNALAILFNRSPDSRQPERKALDMQQDVPVALRLPLAVIAQRPDVQAAEWRLRSTLAGSDVTRLSFYPTLSLGAAIGASSAVFQQWFNNPVRTLSSSIALPFVQWNTVQLTIEKADLDVQQAAIEFRSKVYSALSDVDNAMTQRLSEQKWRENQRKNLQLSQQRLALVNSQYLVGEVSFQTLLDAQDTLLSNENSLSDLQYNYLNATMKLWLALGGGVTDNNPIEGETHD